MWNLIKDQFKAVDWKMLLPTTFILLISWSYAPFAYVVGVQGSHFNSHMGALFLYELCIGIIVPLIVYHKFGSTLSTIPLIASIAVAIIGFSDSFLLMLLLLLLPLFLLVLQLPSMEFQNELGLLTFGTLLMLTISVACAYASLHFISWEIVIFLLPVMASTWFFFAPFFLNNLPRYKFNVTLLGVILLIFTFSRPLRWQIYLAVLIIIGAWFFMIFNVTYKRKSSFILYCLTQMVVIVLIYWS